MEDVALDADLKLRAGGLEGLGAWYCLWECYSLSDVRECSALAQSLQKIILAGNSE